MAECCILINFSPFQDHSYYYKNTDNTKHMLEIHSQLQPRRPGDVLSHMSSGVVRNQQAPSPVPSETPTPFSVGLLSLRHQPSPFPASFSPPTEAQCSPLPLCRNREGVRCQASRNPGLIILLCKEKAHSLIWEECFVICLCRV